MAATKSYAAPQSGGTSGSGTFLIFLASFLTLVAAGMGFGGRGVIKAIWGSDFGFTNTELGQISGMGLAGFGVVILGASLITDRVGYRMIMLMAFLCHIISACIFIATSSIFNSGAGKDGAYWCLFIANTIFSVGNGLAEAAINPLVATLYPTKKTHYLNILHAGWPAGLVLGALTAALFSKMGWEVPLLMYMIPAVIYGFITIKERFPQSEVVTAGISYGEMFSQFKSPLLLFLLLIHACVGYVELGTDSWISNITNKFSGGQGVWLFVYASLLMFVLRFFAGPIVEKINPLGLLFVSACLGMIGLYSIGSAETVALVWVAMTIYALGKTFLWPTMLGVVGERYPRGGAVTMGAMGGIGMLSAGLLGDPGIGYKQDYFATDKLVQQEKATDTYDRYKAKEENQFLFFPKVAGLNNAKKEVILDSKDVDGKSVAAPGNKLNEDIEKLTKAGKLQDSKEILELQKWWEKGDEKANIPPANNEVFIKVDRPKIEEADIYGGRMALKVTAAIPAFMAVCYLLLILYFRATGGYKQEHLHTLTGEAAPNEY